jgi:hypothetical protein
MLPPQRITVGGRDATVIDPDEPAPQATTAAASAGPGWWFDPETATTSIRVPATKVTGAVDVHVVPVRLPPALAPLADSLQGVLARLRDLHDLVNRGWPKAVPSDLLLNLLQTGNRMSLKPASALDELAALQRGLPELARQVEAMSLTPEARLHANALLKELAQR